MVTGNVINAMDSSSVSYLSILLIGCYQNIVANNILVGLPSITTSYGVGVYDSYGVALHGNIIGPNIIKGFTGEYICPNLDEEFITNTPQVVSIIAAGATLTPSPGAKLISMTSSVPTAIIMDDAPTKQGRVIQIVNISTNACNFADTSGVSELAGAFAMGQWDTLTLISLTDRWVELGRSDN